MAEDPYPDREAWPAYWRAIRTAAVWVATIVVIVGVGALLPRPDGFIPRLAIEALIGLAVVLLATAMARWVNGRWERPSA